MDCEAISSLIVGWTLGLAGMMLVVGFMLIFDTQQNRLKRASKKYKDENERYK